MAQPAGTIQPSPKREMSIEEWEDMPEDEPGELVDGYLEEEEVPDFTHEIVVGWLIEMLRRWFVPRGGFVFGSEAKYKLTERRGRKPDVAAYFPGSPRIDPDARTLEIFELGGNGRCILALAVAEGVVTSVPGCADLSLDLNSLWAEVDQTIAEEDDPAP